MLSKPTIKYIQSLQHKKFRDEYNAFIAEGPKLVGELLATRIFECEAVYALPAWINNLDAETLDRMRQRIHPVEEFELSKIAKYDSPNNVVAVFKKKAAAAVVNVDSMVTLVLDDIRDPGNMGTIIRTSDWFGIRNIICSRSSVDIYNSKVVQSTMASLGRVNVVYTDLVPWLDEHRSIQKIAAVLDGKQLSAFEGTREGIVVVGNESNGISVPVLERCDHQLTIPRIGAAESLNAAVSTGIILYGLLKQAR
jgi:TrmH family RNA methyltransferase